MRNSIGSISTGPEASHRLLHIVADETFEMQHLMFASQWVADEFAKKAMRDELQVGQQLPRVGSCLVLGFQSNKVYTVEHSHHLRLSQLQGLISLLSSTSGSLRGSLYEPIMHAVLPKVRKWLRVCWVRRVDLMRLKTWLE
jgi:hypothetical protein